VTDDVGRTGPTVADRGGAPRGEIIGSLPRPGAVSRANPIGVAPSQGSRVVGVINSKAEPAVLAMDDGRWSEATDHVHWRLALWIVIGLHDHPPSVLHE